MSDEPLFSIDCGTCIATGTTACNDCVVTELLAATDTPIELLPTPAAGSGAGLGGVVGLFQQAGLIDDEPVWVEPEEFDAAVR